jgi:hypothetical protein
LWKFALKKGGIAEGIFKCGKITQTRKNWGGKEKFAFKGHFEEKFGKICALGIFRINYSKKKMFISKTNLCDSLCKLFLDLCKQMITKNLLVQIFDVMI